LRGEVASLPEQDELFQTAQQAREAGHYEGVQRRLPPAVRRIGQGGLAQRAELFGQQGRGF